VLSRVGGSSLAEQEIRRSRARSRLPAVHCASYSVRVCERRYLSRFFWPLLQTQWNYHRLLLRPGYTGAVGIVLSRALAALLR